MICENFEFISIISYTYKAVENRKQTNFYFILICNVILNSIIFIIKEVGETTLLVHEHKMHHDNQLVSVAFLTNSDNNNLKDCK